MNQLNVLPYPAIVEYVGPEALHLSNPVIHCDIANESLLQKATYLQQALQQRFGTHATICQQHSSQQAPGTVISLLLVEQLQQLQQFCFREEGYQLTCSAQGVEIAALTTTGVFYGIQTLLQAPQSSPEGLTLQFTQVCRQQGPGCLAAACNMQCAVMGRGQQQPTVPSNDGLAVSPNFSVPCDCSCNAQLSKQSSLACICQGSACIDVLLLTEHIGSRTSCIACFCPSDPCHQHALSYAITTNVAGV
jgi:hypothetical protein